MRKLPILSGTASVVALSLLAGAPAVGQETSRYTLERTERGFVRMDQDTGQISLCEEIGKSLVCRMAADDRDAYAADIEALEARIAALEALLGEPNAPALTPRPSEGLPSEKDFETTLDYMERFFRRFKGLADEFSGSDSGSAEPAPAPDKT